MLWWHLFNIGIHELYRVYRRRLFRHRFVELYSMRRRLFCAYQLFCLPNLRRWLILSFQCWAVHTVCFREHICGWLYRLHGVHSWHVYGQLWRYRVPKLSTREVDIWILGFCCLHKLPRWLLLPGPWHRELH